MPRWYLRHLGFHSELSKDRGSLRSRTDELAALLVKDELLDALLVCRLKGWNSWFSGAKVS